MTRKLNLYGAYEASGVLVGSEILSCWRELGLFYGFQYKSEKYTSDPKESNE